MSDAELILFAIVGIIIFFTLFGRNWQRAYWRGYYEAWERNNGRPHPDRLKKPERFK